VAWREPTRVLILGSGGAGKSTLARALGRRSGLPVIHLDTLYWRPGWVEPTREVWREQLGPVLAEPRWIIDGNYGASVKQRAAYADLVIVLDRPRRVTMPNIVRRRLRYRGRTRPDMAEGCAEHLTWEFVRYCWTYRRVSLPKLYRRLSEAGATNVVVLTDQASIDALVDGWPDSVRGRARPPAC
jgi:adenylate kinase family enzyme